MDTLKDLYEKLGYALLYGVGFVVNLCWLYWRIVRDKMI
jgi:hypothetical protein